MSVKDVLQEIMKTDGVDDALIVGRDGFVIEHVGQLQADMIGVAVSTVIGAVEAMGRTTEKGNLFEIMAEFDGGTIISAPVGNDAVLGVTARQGGNLGGIRFAVKKNIEPLKRML
ncbi:roadblock/LC7 domain-containing protein [Myxococcota bacterium]|nr:roadblock/LC7 domain-containing protein [Myxococcota bacterium]